MSTEIIDLSEKVKRAYYEKRYYDFHQHYNKLIYQFSVSKKLPMDRHLMDESKKYYNDISTDPKYKEEIKYNGVVPHKLLTHSTIKLKTNNEVFIPTLAKPEPFKKHEFVQQNINFHNSNMTYLFNTHAQRQQDISSTFHKAKLYH